MAEPDRCRNIAVRRDARRRAGGIGGCRPRALGGHSESSLGGVISDPVTLANFNSVLRSDGFLQRDAYVMIVFYYGASLGDGSFGQILPPCIQPVGAEGFLLLSVYAQQFPFNNQYVNGELLYCSLTTTWADPNNSWSFANRTT
jgi:hypothetical protein